MKRPFMEYPEVRQYQYEYETALKKAVEDRDALEIDRIQDEFPHRMEALKNAIEAREETLTDQQIEQVRQIIQEELNKAFKESGF